MTNLQDALFPPIDDDETPNEAVILELFHELKSNRRPDLAVSAAVLVQQEIDMWKERIAELERQQSCRSPPVAVIVDEDEDDMAAACDDDEAPFPALEDEVLHKDSEEEEEDSMVDQ